MENSRNDRSNNRYRADYISVKRVSAPIAAGTGVSPQQVEKYTSTPKKRGRFVLKSGLLVVRLPKIIDRLLHYFAKHRLLSRILSLTIALLLLFTVFYTAFNEHFKSLQYKLSPKAEALVGKPSDLYSKKLQYDSKQGMYQYNQGYSPSNGEVGGQISGPKFTATFYDDPAKGIQITDPQYNSSLAIKPKFRLEDPQKDQNRLVYPLAGKQGAKVLSLRAGSVKEDIILEKYYGDSMKFDYELVLPAALEAKIEADGSLGIYGADNTALIGDVTTGNDQDAQLLEKARKNAKKTKLVFQMPAPFIKETGNKIVKKTAKFELKNNILTMRAEKLKDLKYPISIDPTVYIETAAKLMKGNNESNIDFDVTNELIQKSQTTGARIDAWSSTTNLSSSVFGQGTAVAGGYIYSAGGGGAGTPTTQVYNTAGTTAFVVPTGVTSITVKAWGAGGGGGGGNNGGGIGGAGGGGGYAKAVISVTPAESLDVLVGTAGAKATTNTAAGNGGGYSALKRSATFLLQAGGGGGGGGTRGSRAGGAGGAGGGSSGVAGSSPASGGGGGGAGTNAAGGAAGAAGTGGAAGRAGIANAGGNGMASVTSCATSTAGTGGAGGTGAGGSGGIYTGASCSNGGGGGGGRYGGGGGGTTNSNNRGGGGGGGGSDLVTGTSTVETAGSGTTPGNSGDSDRGGLGDGGSGGATAAAASAGDSGIVVISYVIPGSVTNTVSWAKFNTSTNAIESPNPGTGACTGWCNNSVYNLPVALTDLSLVAYNGFLYAIGGATSAGTPQTTVYIAKLGANGEPQLWHPSGGTAGYWYTDTALSNARSRFAAVAYNNRMYILGGLTTSSTVLSSNTVQYADIKPTGAFGSWTSTGMQALSTARYGLTAHVYNDVLYAIGGDATLGGTPVSTVEYSKLNSDGTMNSWVTTSSMATSGRLTVGGSYSTIFGGYVYIAGGCTTVNASGYCTAIASDVQLASINADGSLSEWNTVIGLTNDRFAHTLIAWQGGLYRMGGCRAQDSSSGACTDTVIDVDYGVINPDGEASTVATSVASGGSPCSGATPYGCNLPSASVGNMLNASVIVNGYLYIMGGCTNNACTSVSSGITYQSIGSDGTLQKPASCTGSYTDSYCVSSVTLPAAMGAPGTAVFNGRIYLVGGFPTITNISHISVNADGSLGSWTNTDFTVIAANGIDDDLSYTFAYARANPNSASSIPGNLFIFGGCTGDTSGIGCSSYSDSVYKCDLNTSGVPSNCTITGQTQIGTVTGASGTGLGAHAGAVYANYIYLMGGLAPSITDLTTVRYAKFDDSNNVVESDGAGTTAWTESANDILVGRRRGAGFGYNGYLYVTGGYDGTDALADIEFARIEVSDGSIGAWDSSSVSINKRWGLSLAVSNSYAYVIGGCTAGAAPSSCSTRTDSIQTFQVYNNDSGTIKSVTSTVSDDGFAASTDRWGASSAIYTDTSTEQSYLYVAGGCTSTTDCTTATGDIQYISISKSDGSLTGNWASATKGIGDSGSGAQVRAWGKLVIVGSYMYYLGGQTSTSTDERSEVYYVPVAAGNITTNWSTATKALGDTGSGGNARTKFGVAVWNNRIYVVGGLDGSAAVTNTVYISPQPSSGNLSSNWTSDADVPDVARYGAAVTAYANNLYMFGGNNGTQYLNDGQFTQINSDGTVDAWTFTTSTPGFVSEAEAFAANGYMYIVGGRSAATSCKPKTLISPISANTTIATGNNPTGVGEWYETNVRYTGGRYGSAVTYKNGKIYVMGGGCTSPIGPNYTTGTITQSGTTVTGAGGASWTDNYIGATITYNDASTATIVSVNSATSLTVSASKTIASAQTYTISQTRHNFGVVKSQPQMAKYSRMIDTNSDVFPNSWLMNGLDNSIGARWQVKYRSMNDIDGVPTDCGSADMSTWGQETNFGDVTLGNVETYTPKDGSGTNINCARYYFFNVSIDASQTFGYPEDVNRGPTIADLSLFFTSDPSKRLRHGKTFTGGEQQPLDTPCRQSGGQANCPLP